MSIRGATEAATLISAFSRLAWPVALVILVLAFRRPIAEQVSRVQAFKAGGAEVTFAARVDDALRASAKLVTQVVGEVAAARQDYLLQLASRDPREAVHQGWELVREAAQGVARRRQLAWTTTKALVEDMDKKKLLDGETVQLVLNLRSLRYDVADDPAQEVTSTAANTYVLAATSAMDLLSKVPADSSESDSPTHPDAGTADVGVEAASA
jgi:hypothetical protein